MGKSYPSFRGAYSDRLEVFKRDKFTCLLCGSAAPNVTITIAEYNDDWATVCTACAAGLKPARFSIELPARIRVESVDRPVSQWQIFCNYFVDHLDATPQELSEATGIVPGTIYTYRQRYYRRNANEIKKL